MNILDPDRKLFTPDKLQHVIGGFALGILFSVFGPGCGNAMLLTLAIALAFEIGQYDAARSLPCSKKTPGPGFLPGFGIGLLDLAVTLAGGLAGIALYGLLIATGVVSRQDNTREWRVPFSSTLTRGTNAVYSDASFRVAYSARTSLSPRSLAFPVGAPLARV